MGSVDFRVGGRIFATLASQAQGYGNLMLTPVEQAAFVEELPAVFVPIAGGWGRMGMTHVVLAEANEDLLRGALQTAWRLRREANARTKPKRRTPAGEPERAGTKRVASRPVGDQSRRMPSRTSAARTSGDTSSARKVSTAGRSRRSAGTTKS